MQDRNSASDLAAVRCLALFLLKQDAAVKRSMKTKRFNCALDRNYLIHILNNAKYDAQALEATRLTDLLDPLPVNS